MSFFKWLFGLFLGKNKEKEGSNEQEEEKESIVDHIKEKLHELEIGIEARPDRLSEFERIFLNYQVLINVHKAKIQDKDYIMAQVQNVKKLIKKKKKEASIKA